MKQTNKQKSPTGGAPQEIKITDKITGAEYANLMQVMHTREEFRLVFAHVFEPTGKVVSKVTTTPAHFKRMVNALKENLDRYEKENGEIEDVEGLSEQRIGFK